jgi:RecA-family ATPase
LLPNHSLAHYARRPINHDNTLLGNRWLCRTNGEIIVAPSGMGKSSCSFQTAILWSCGRSAFGIKPPKPWRILILQAEDDDDDTTEMCAMLDNPKLGLIDPEKQLVERNTHLDLERVNDCTGQNFLEVMEGYLDQSEFDMVILNPLSAYVGDPGDTKEMSSFLRIGLNRLLVKFNSALC